MAKRDQGFKQNICLGRVSSCVPVCPNTPTAYHLVRCCPAVNLCPFPSALNVCSFIDVAHVKSVETEKTEKPEAISAEETPIPSPAKCSWLPIAWRSPRPKARGIFAPCFFLFFRLLHRMVRTIYVYCTTCTIYHAFILNVYSIHALTISKRLRCTTPHISKHAAAAVKKL